VFYDVHGGVIQNAEARALENPDLANLSGSFHDDLDHNSSFIVIALSRARVQRRRVTAAVTHIGIKLNRARGWLVGRWWRGGQVGSWSNRDGSLDRHCKRN
jgi:hypothetical protein